MPRTKMLTMPELAQRVNASQPMKRKLAAAAQQLFPKPLREDNDLFEKLFVAMGMALDAMVQSQGPRRPMRRYHITCKGCELDRIVEITTDLRNVGLSVHCCKCGEHSSFAVPEGDAEIQCSHCGQLTRVELVTTSA